jgi:hypothetical protein
MVSSIAAWRKILLGQSIGLIQIRFGTLFGPVFAAVYAGAGAPLDGVLDLIPQGRGEATDSICNEIAAAGLG